MNIAVYHNLPVGGGKRALWSFMKMLVDHQGFTFDLYTLSTSDRAFFPLQPLARNTFITEYECTPFIISGTPFITNVRNLFRLRENILRMENICKEVAGQINQKNYDIVFVHPCKFFAASPLLRYLKRPSVYFCQEPPRYFYEPEVFCPGSEPSKQSQSASPSFVQKITGLLYALRQHKFKQQDLINTRHATLILANSYYSRESLYKIYGKFPRVNYLGVDPEIFQPLPDIQKAPIVLTVGRLFPFKQHHFVIQSVGFIPEKLRPTVVAVAASGDKGYSTYEAYLRQLAEQLNVQFTMRALKTDDDLVLWYNRASVVAYPPILEPLGLVPLEAMACQTPVVGIREGGIRETIQHGETGLLTERDEQDFARAIAMLLQNQTLRERMGTTGRDYILKHWTWEKRVNNLVNHFQAVC